MNVRPLASSDRGYAIKAWTDAHKCAPPHYRAPWYAYKREYGDLFKRIVDDASTVLLGAYDERDRLVAFLVMTPGKRVHTLHWCQVKSRLDGQRVPNRRQIFFDLLDAARLGRAFVYTLRGPRCKIGDARSLDEVLVAALRDRGISATHVPLKEWLK